jgi:hypothetical protein
LRSDAVDIVVVQQRPSMSKADRRIAMQLELARHDARMHTLRVTTVPLTVGALLAFLAIWIGKQSLAPQTSPWLGPLSTVIAAIGWSGFISSLDPTSEVMPLAGATISMCINALSAFAEGSAALAGFASIEPKCAALAPALFESGSLALVCSIFVATAVTLGVGLASWRAHRKQGADPIGMSGVDPIGMSGVQCGLPLITSRRLVDHVWICSGCTYLGVSVQAVYATAIKLVFALPSKLPELTTMLICSSTALLWWSTTVRVRVHAFLVSGGEPIATAAGARAARASTVRAARDRALRMSAHRSALDALRPACDVRHNDAAWWL